MWKKKKHMENYFNTYIKNNALSAFKKSKNKMTAQRSLLV